MRRVIVDGYNVIHTDARYSALADRDLDAARARLVADVSAWATSRGSAAVVVFDGGGNPASDGSPHSIAGITVRFSPAGGDADAMIEGLARAARDADEETVVVTSDAATQWVAMGRGVTRMSSAEFVREVGSGSTEWREHTPSGSPRSRIDDRIDPAVRDELAAWARAGGRGTGR
jgi:ribosomal protection tetracycline resistance protein